LKANAYKLSVTETTYIVPSERPC